MPIKKGRDLLLEIEAGATLVPVAGLRARRLAFDAQQVEATDAGSAGRWRELIAATGVRRASISGSGVFRDAQSDELVRQAFFSGAAPVWRVTIPGFGLVAGAFQIVSLEYRGDAQGELAFSITLESAGAIAFSAL